MEISLWQLASGAGVIIGLLFSHVIRSPKETIKALESRIQAMETQHNLFVQNHTGSYARLDETVKHLSAVVSKFDQSLGELRQIMMNGGHNGRPR